jgi:hypothetical protein
MAAEQPTTADPTEPGTDAASEPDPGVDLELGRRLAVASHRLVGWIFWDPGAIERYAALGVPDGLGYYIASRAAPLADAGHQAVTAAFGSIHPDFVRFALAHCAAHTTFADAAAARDRAVVDGLHAYAPSIVDGLGDFAEPLWSVADELPSAGRVLFAAHREWPRPTEEPLLSAWLAVNCLREWRGDTHWAIQVADGISMTAAGLLDGAWRGYPDEWLPRSRGADDASVTAAWDELARRGFVTDGRVNAAGVAHRQAQEDLLDEHCLLPWRLLGVDRCRRFLELVEPVGPALMARIDETAGPLWMPAGRDRRPPV